MNILGYELTFPTGYTLGLLGFILSCLAGLYLFYRFGGFQELKKIWCDIHLNPATGRYSQKRLVMSGSIFLGWFICFTQALTINVFPSQEFNSKEVPLWVPLLLFTVGLGATAAVLLGHLNARRTADKNGNPLDPAYSEPEPPKDILVDTLPDPEDPVVETESANLTTKEKYKINQAGKIL